MGDNQTIKQLAQVTGAYENTASMLQKSAEFATAENPGFDKLAKDHEDRANSVKAFFSSLPPSPGAANISPEEKNAILYLVSKQNAQKAKDSLVGDLRSALDSAKSINSASAAAAPAAAAPETNAAS